MSDEVPARFKPGKHAARNRKNKERKRKREAFRFAASLANWTSCCHGRLVEWDCGCLHGCECCDVHLQCRQCGTLYRSNEITKLKAATKPTDDHVDH